MVQELRCSRLKGIRYMLGLTKLTWSMLRWIIWSNLRWAKQRLERINETKISKYVRKHLLMIQY